MLFYILFLPLLDAFRISPHQNSTLTLSLRDLSRPHVLRVATSADISISLSFCPIGPTELIVKEGRNVTLLLSPSRLVELRDKTHCSFDIDPFYTGVNGNNRIYITVTAGSNEANGELTVLPFMKPGTAPSHSNTALLGGKEFVVRGGAYESINIQLNHIENGLLIEALMEYGEVQIFASFCADFLGHPLGSSSWKSSLAVSFDAPALASLIESHSCPGQSILYQNTPSSLILRLHAQNASGVVQVSELEKAQTFRAPKVMKRRSLPQEDIEIDVNHTASLVFPYTNVEFTGVSLEFEIKSGSVNLEVSLCLIVQGGQGLLIDNYSTGLHTVIINETILDELMNTTCSNSSDSMSQALHVLFSSSEPASMRILSTSITEDEDTFLTPFVLIAIVLGSVLLVVLSGGALYLLSRRKTGSISMAQMRYNNTYNIPMTNSWM